jgi:hypothetical protein
MSPHTSSTRRCARWYRLVHSAPYAAGAFVAGAITIALPSANGDGVPGSMGCGTPTFTVDPSDPMCEKDPRRGMCVDIQTPGNAMYSGDACGHVMGVGSIWFPCGNPAQTGICE